MMILEALADYHGVPNESERRAGRRAKT